MASNLPVPDFVSGQALLARDFAALVEAVRDLMGGCLPAVDVVRGGRRFRPFARAGECVLFSDADGNEVGHVAEVLMQVGENVSWLRGMEVFGMAGLVQAQEQGLRCGVHAEVVWQYVGSAACFGLRAKDMENCALVVWQEGVWQEDGSYSGGGVHGDVVFSVVEAGPNALGQVTDLPVPWVVPQCPALVWRSSNGDCRVECLMGEVCLLPAPVGEEQLLAFSGGGFFCGDGSFQGVNHEWRGRLDRYGVLHLLTVNKVL